MQAGGRGFESHRLHWPFVSSVPGHEPGADQDPSHLVCYSINNEHFDNPPSPFIHDEFQSNQITLDGHVVVLCVPSTKQIVSAAALTSAASALPGSGRSAPAGAFLLVTTIAALFTTALGMRRRRRSRFAMNKNVL